MDYKKIYNEALERARELATDLPNGRNDRLYHVWDLESIFPELAESEDEKIRKEILDCFISMKRQGCFPSKHKEKYDSWVGWLEKQGEQQDKGEISDGYHTFNELYYYRMLYNAAFFNMLPEEWVHKSKKHHDGEDCFGGGWFIVMANLPTGQISNHYELKNWDLFQIPEKEVADKWDGHTPQEAADRLHKYLLEKQNEKFRYWKPSEEQLEALDYAYNSCPDTERGNYYEGVLETLIDDLYKLSEKQGEDKEINNFDVIPGLYKCVHRMFDGTPDGKLLFEVGNIYKCLSKHDRAEFEVSYGHSVYLEDPVVCKHFIPFERQEQKPTDKVEPKFKIGDWIVSDLDDVNEDFRLCKIIGIEDGCYTIQSTNGCKGYNFFEIWESDYHLWTIQDAKDGDVLANEDTNIIGIFDGIEGLCWHCKFFYSNFTKEFYGMGCSGSRVESAKPATKEQRDLLFSKMKEKGYEWDAENKVLKKIEDKPLVIDEGKAEMDYCFTKMMTEYYAKQKPDIEMKTPEESLGVDSDTWNKIVDECVYGEQKPVEWKQENVEELSDFENAMMHIGGSFFGENAGLDPNDTALIKEQAELLLELAPKTEWSEDDEKNYKVLLEIYQSWSNGTLASQMIPSTYDKYLTWFKSIKDRVRPKLALSEEDKNILKAITYIVKNSGYKHCGGISNEIMVDWLKSLKQRIGE